jgi:hypothetical protein
MSDFAAAVAKEPHVPVDRIVLLERHGRVYGELRLAVTFTDGLEGDAAKRVRENGWNKTIRLSDGNHGASLVRGRGARRNPAVVLGPSGLLGVDNDGPEGVALLRRHVPEGLPLTVTVLTGKDDGYHFWFRRPPDAATSFVELGPEGVIVKANQYLLAPPSLHPSGRVYRFAEGRAPWEVEIADLPAAILKRLEQAAQGQRERRAASEGPIQAGGRHDHLMRLGCAMRRRGASLAAVRAALLAENEARCQPPKSTDVVTALADDLHQRYGPA